MKFKCCVLASVETPLRKALDGWACHGARAAWAWGYGQRWGSVVTTALRTSQWTPGASGSGYLRCPKLCFVWSYPTLMRIVLTCLPMSEVKKKKRKEKICSFSLTDTGEIWSMAPLSHWVPVGCGYLTPQRALENPRQLWNRVVLSCQHTFQQRLYVSHLQAPDCL